MAYRVAGSGYFQRPRRWSISTATRRRHCKRWAKDCGTLVLVAAMTFGTALAAELGRFLLSGNLTSTRGRAVVHNRLG